MGLVEKALRKRSNQKLAAPIYATTAMADVQIIEALRGIVDTHNAETVREVERWKTTGNRISRWANKDKDPQKEHYYHLDVRSDGALIGFRRTPERILAEGRKSPGFDSY